MAIDKNDPTIKDILARLDFVEGRIGGGKVVKPTADKAPDTTKAPATNAPEAK